MDYGRNEKYNSVARLLHWVIALAIIAEVAMGLGHETWKDSFAVMPIHKATGITILALSLFRLYWRLSHKPPPLPSTVPGWQAASAAAVHWLFYFLMIAVPVTGWLLASSGKSPVQWFGLFDIPKWPVEKGSALAEAAHEGHEIMSKLFIPLIMLHIGAALYHGLSRKDGVLRRML